MGPNQDEQRQAAAEAFVESLNQLEQSLQEGKRQVSDSRSVGERSMGLSKTPDIHPIDAKALEEAVADIEQLL